MNRSMWWEARNLAGKQYSWIVGDITHFVYKKSLPPANYLGPSYGSHLTDLKWRRPEPSRSTSVPHQCRGRCGSERRSISSLKVASKLRCSSRCSPFPLSFTFWARVRPLSYQRLVISAATSRPPNPKARPMANATEPTRAM